MVGPSNDWIGVLNDGHMDQVEVFVGQLLNRSVEHCREQCLQSLDLCNDQFSALVIRLFEVFVHAFGPGRAHLVKELLHWEEEITVKQICLLNPQADVAEQLPLRHIVGVAGESEPVMNQIVDCETESPSEVLGHSGSWQASQVGIHSLEGQLRGLRD